MTSPSPSEPRTPSLYHAALDPAAAVIVLLVTVLIWFVTMVILAASRAPIPVVLAAGGVVFIAVPFAFARKRKLGPDTFGLTWPRPPFLAAAVLIGCSFWLLNALAWSWVHASTKTLEHAIDEPPLVVALLLACVLAPIGEELLFRGMLARSIAKRLPVGMAIPISAVVFGAYHMNLAQLGPATTTGCVLAFVALRANSIVPTILLHALNNAFAVVFARPDTPDFQWLLEAYPVPALAVAALATGGGLALVARSRP